MKLEEWKTRHYNICFTLIMTHKYKKEKSICKQSNKMLQLNPVGLNRLNPTIKLASSQNDKKNVI